MRGFCVNFLTVAGNGDSHDQQPPDPAELRAAHAAGELAAFGEVTNQYAGIAPDYPRMEPYWSLMEELDVPVGIHIGTGPPGVIHLGSPGYRASLHSALTRTRHATA